LKTASSRQLTAFNRALALAFLTALTVGLGGLAGFVPPMASAILLAISGAILIIAYRVGRVVKPPSGSLYVVFFGFSLIVVALFWAASIYAADMGEEAAKRIAAGELGRPEVVIFSKSNLMLPGSEDTGYPSRDPENWSYKYRGYTLLTYSNERWFLIMADWSPKSPTVVLPDDGSVRVDLIPQGHR
jgi:hypothetical protein